MPKEFNPREKKKLSSSFAGERKLHSVENYELENHKRKYENKLKDQQEELIVSKAMTEGAIKDLNEIIRSLSDRHSKITTEEFQALLRGQELEDLAKDVKGSMQTLRDENEELRNSPIIPCRQYYLHKLHNQMSQLDPLTLLIHIIYSFPYNSYPI